MTFLSMARGRTRPVLANAVLLILLALWSSAGCAAGDSANQVPEKKRTRLGLYATAAETHAAWEAAPDEVIVLDVRTPEEFIFVGHPEMAWNVPFMTHRIEWIDGQAQFGMEPNPGFADAVKALAAPEDTIYVICRSGGRSAAAVDVLADAGFTTAYSVIDGMEGDKVRDEKSPDYGHRTVNGWKNAGLPWTYQVDPVRMVMPAGQ